MGAEVGGGGLCPRPNLGPSSDNMDATRFASSPLGGDDNPVRTGVVGEGVDGPGEDSSLFSLSPCNCPFSVTRSSSSSNTGSVVCGTSSECDNELRDMLRGLFTEIESVLEKSHESNVSWNVDEARFRRSWRCVRGGIAPDKIKVDERGRL